MSDRETSCWVVGSIALGLLLLICGIGYFECRLASIKAEAQVQVAHEIGTAVSSFGQWWQD